MSKSKITILVVDDTRYNLQILSIMLANQGYAVLEAANGIDAIDLAKAHMPSLILLDIKMPEMSGLELARQARALNPGLAVIIMTGQTTLETLREAVQQGVTSYLSKPFEIEEMRLCTYLRTPVYTCVPIRANIIFVH